MKKKIIYTFFMIFLILCIVLVLCGVNYFWKKAKTDGKLSVMKKNYAPYVYLNGYLYDKKHQKIATGKITLRLEELKEIDEKQEYFKVLNYDYYVNYNDITKCNDNILSDNYDFFESVFTITTKNKFTLYNSNSSIIFDRPLSFQVLIIEQNRFLIKYLDQDFYINREDVLKITKEKNSYQKQVPIFKIGEIKQECLDTLCLTYERFEELLRILKEEDLYILNSKNYNKFINEELFFKEDKTIVGLFFDKKVDSRVMQLLKKYDVELVTGMKKTTKIKEYLITDSFNKKRIDDMLNLQDIKIDKNQKVPVLNYHFFYPDGNFKICGETICISDKLFKEHLEYLLSEEYYFLTMSEYIDFMYERIAIPKKSILITIDDGAMGTYDILPEILNQYKVPATLFLISGWWNIDKYKQSTYLEIYSHGHDLHHNDYCNSTSCGIKTLLLDKESLVNDLNLSIATIKSKKAFCYPFYASNSKIERIVKDTGFQVAFSGGNTFSTIDSNKYHIPRFVIYNDTTVKKLEKLLTNS